MNHDHNNASDMAVCSLQSEPVCCKLQSACKLESNEINHLGQFADCRPQIAETLRNLTKNPVTTGPSAAFSDCTQTPTPYRGSRDSLANAGDHYLNVGLVGRLSAKVGEDDAGGIRRC